MCGYHLQRAFAVPTCFLLKHLSPNVLLPSYLCVLSRAPYVLLIGVLTYCCPATIFPYIGLCSPYRLHICKTPITYGYALYARVSLIAHLSAHDYCRDIPRM